MPEKTTHPHLVPFDDSFRVSSAASSPPVGTERKKLLKRRLVELKTRLADVQHRFYAHDKFSLLLVFQAMDAAGKDGTIRSVMSGVNPAGCRVVNFKEPSAEDLEHDFLWRTARHLPERGSIGIFNRSYYEEVLVVRVHPELLEGQHLPVLNITELWSNRFESIREHERHLARNGTVILKFWLNVSKKEQKRRFLARLTEPEKHWKFSQNDVNERRHWDHYMQAYEEVLRATSRPWAPWYAIPANSKAYMRVAVCEIVVDALEGLGVRFPEVTTLDQLRFKDIGAILEAEGE